MKKSKSYPFILAGFTAPALLFFTVLVAYPIVEAIYGAMLNWDGISAGKWIAFQNYSKLFSSSVFVRCQTNTIIYLAVMLGYMLIIGALAAILLTTLRSRIKDLFRSAYFLPVIISTTVVCQMWLSFFNYDTGAINQLFAAMGFSYRQEWLTDSSTAIITVAFVNAWQYMGLAFMMYYTNVRSIPEEYFEAARIDGANVFQIHRYITLPLVQEALRFTLVFAVSASIRAFDTIFIMTGGGPGDYTNTLAYLMYKSAFIQGKYGYGCAVSVVIVVESLICYFVVNKIVDSRDVYKERG